MSSRRRLTRTLAGAVLVTALAAPAASARPTDVYTGNSERSTPSDEPTVTRTIDEGIDAGSAALGAGGASAVLLLTAAGAAAVMHTRRRVNVID